MLEAICKHRPSAKVLRASSSEMFGKVRETPENARTSFYLIRPHFFYRARNLYGQQNHGCFRKRVIGSR